MYFVAVCLCSGWLSGSKGSSCAAHLELQKCSYLLDSHMKKPKSQNHFGWKGSLRCVHAVGDEGIFFFYINTKAIFTTEMLLQIISTSAENRFLRFQLSFHGFLFRETTLFTSTSFCLILCLKNDHSEPITTIYQCSTDL